MDIKFENGSRITSIGSSEYAKRSNRGNEQLKDNIKYFRKHPDVLLGINLKFYQRILLKLLYNHKFCKTRYIKNP